MAIEKKLDDVVEMEKQILSCLEEDKESKIEGDLKTLTTIIKEYKFNWDNATYTATHHQLAADIKRDAEANMIFYQKQVADTIKENSALFLQQFVNSQQATLVKHFKYYRMSLYIFGFASFVEVMLQGKFDEGYIQQVRQEIIDRSDKYHETYDAFSRCLWLRSQEARQQTANLFYARSNRAGVSIWSDCLMVRHLPAKEAAQYCA